MHDFHQMKTSEHNEAGNILFLILIAVMLFAALSFAVMQSSQSSGSGKGNEGATVNAAQINQYPAIINAAIMRMNMNGVEITELEFNPPSEFGNLTSPQFAVFDSTTFGTTYLTAPATVMANNQAGNWHFNGNFEVQNLGESVAGDFAGNEIIGFLPGVKDTVCRAMNEKLQIPVMPQATAAYLTDAMVDMDDTYTPPSSETVIGEAGLPALADLTSQPFGCFQDSGSGEYIYYHVVYEQ
jgi:hypothetical protein